MQRVTSDAQICAIALQSSIRPALSMQWLDVIFQWANARSGKDLQGDFWPIQQCEFAQQLGKIGDKSRVEYWTRSDAEEEEEIKDSGVVKQLDIAPDAASIFPHVTQAGPSHLLLNTLQWQARIASSWWIKRSDTLKSSDSTSRTWPCVLVKSSSPGKKAPAASMLPCLAKRRSDSALLVVSAPRSSLSSSLDTEAFVVQDAVTLYTNQADWLYGGVDTIMRNHILLALATATDSPPTLIASLLSRHFTGSRSSGEEEEEKEKDQEEKKEKTESEQLSSVDIHIPSTFGDRWCLPVTVDGKTILMDSKVQKDSKQSSSVVLVFGDRETGSGNELDVLENMPNIHLPLPLTFGSLTLFSPFFQPGLEQAILLKCAYTEPVGGRQWLARTIVVLPCMPVQILTDTHSAQLVWITEIEREVQELFETRLKQQTTIQDASHWRQAMMKHLTSVRLLVPSLCVAVLLYRQPSSALADEWISPTGLLP